MSVVMIDGDHTDVGEVGDLLRKARERRGLAMQKVHERSGMSGSAIGSYERGERQISIAKLRKLAVLYDVTFSIGPLP